MTLDGNLHVPPSVPRRGSAAWRAIGRFVMRATGWRVEGAFPDRSRFVVAVAPHTSNWDFLHGAAGMFALDLRVSFIAKHTLFVWPFSWFLRWMGGVAVDRRASHGVVEHAIISFKRLPSFVLVIAPEGTRSRVERFKSGFLHIAKGAGVPVVLVALDYANRRICIGPIIPRVEDVEGERIAAESHFAKVSGLRER